MDHPWERGWKSQASGLGSSLSSIHRPLSVVAHRKRALTGVKKRPHWGQRKQMIGLNKNARELSVRVAFALCEGSTSSPVCRSVQVHVQTQCRTAYFVDVSQDQMIQGWEFCRPLKIFLFCCVALEKEKEKTIMRVILYKLLVARWNQPLPFTPHFSFLVRFLLISLSHHNFPLGHFQL